jgi:hypothetical protein
MGLVGQQARELAADGAFVIAAARDPRVELGGSAGVNPVVLDLTDPDVADARPRRLAILVNNLRGVTEHRFNATTSARHAR